MFSHLTKQTNVFSVGCTVESNVRIIPHLQLILRQHRMRGSKPHSLYPEASGNNKHSRVGFKLQVSLSPQMHAGNILRPCTFTWQRFSILRVQSMRVSRSRLLCVLCSLVFFFYFFNCTVLFPSMHSSVWFLWFTGYFSLVIAFQSLLFDKLLITLYARPRSIIVCVLCVYTVTVTVTVRGVFIFRSWGPSLEIHHGPTVTVTTTSGPVCLF